MLELKNVYLAYTKDYNTLNDINLDLPNGKQIIIYGSKDSGRTSLVRVMLGLEACTKGDVYINNVNVKQIDFKKDAQVGYVHIKGVFLENQTVKQNLEYVLSIRKMDKVAIDVKVNNALYSFDLKRLENVKVKELNKFDRIKLSLARISEREIELIITDDVFENFNLKENKEIISYIKKIIKQNQSAAVILCSSKEILDLFNYKQYQIKFGTLSEMPIKENEE